MKRFTLILVLFLLSIQIVSAQAMKEFNTTIDIEKNGGADVEVIFRFTDAIKEVYLPLKYDISDLRVEGGKCYVEKYLESTLICKPSSPFVVGQTIINARFKLESVTKIRDNKTFFNLDIPILQDTERVNIIVKLPELMALVDNELLPISPSNADIGSDGRRIVINWNFHDQFTGDIIPLRIYYENLNPSNVFQLINFKWVVFFLLIIAVGVFLIYDKVSKRSSIVLSVLNEAERIIVNIIQDKGGKDVDQRILVTSSGFSKAKVSRILQSLEARGVVSLERTGRKNKVILKKKFIKEETEQ